MGGLWTRHSCRRFRRRNHPCRSPHYEEAHSYQPQKSQVTHRGCHREYQGRCSLPGVSYWCKPEEDCKVRWRRHNIWVLFFPERAFKQKIRRNHWGRAVRSNHKVKFDQPGPGLLHRSNEIRRAPYVRQVAFPKRKTEEETLLRYPQNPEPHGFCLPGRQWRRQFLCLWGRSKALSPEHWENSN